MRITNFLSEGLSTEILNYAIDHEDRFQDSTVYENGETSVSKSRVSKTYGDLGKYGDVMQKKILTAFPEIAQQLQIAPFEVGEIELQLAAHGDGALFVAHIDTLVHERKVKPRIISLVYYLHSDPKQFSGGHLRMHPLPIGDEPAEPVDIAPDHNLLLAFPSFAPHEVLPVHAPDLAFKDWRFAVNCWIHRA